MEPYPDLVSLIVNRDVIPYNDLEISPGYGRKILLPDDLPPVLSLGWALGPNVPRAFRCEDNGALHVFQTNSSGGGGSLPTVTLTGPEGYGDISQNLAGGTATFPFDVTGLYATQYLYGFSLQVNGLQAAVDRSAPGQCRLRAHTGGAFVIPLASFVMVTEAADKMSNPYNVTVIFPFRIDVFATLSATQWNVDVTIPGSGATFSAGFQPYTSN